MNEPLQTYKVFSDPETAQSFADLLQLNDIEYRVEEDSVVFDPTYANNPLQKDYRVLIRREDFPRADKALETYYRAQLDAVDPDHYLFSFSNEELQGIISHPDEWGPLDYQLAQKILKERGVEVSEQEVVQRKGQRLRALAQPETAKQSSLIQGYVFGLLFSPLGIILGWIWGYSTKTLPDGWKVRAYDTRTQRHGKTLFVLSLLLLALTVLGRILEGQPSTID